MKFINVSIIFFLSLFFCSLAHSKYEPSKEVLDVIANAEKYDNSLIYTPPPPFKIYDNGSVNWIDYSKYGEFQKAGTADYKYIIKDEQGLAAASGEGIYPNVLSVQNSLQFKQFLKDKKLKGDKFSFVYSDDYQANFYKWAASKGEDPGLKLYYTAYALEKAGNFKHAVKAYYACLVFFPKTVGYTQWQTPWYIAPVCEAKIKYLTAAYPEIGARLEGSDITVENSFDNDVKNDVFIINPGRMVLAKEEDFVRKYADLKKENIKKVFGTGKVKIILYNNGHFALTVDEKPYIVKAVSYSPSKIGLSPDFGTLNNARDWTYDDYNSNRKIDAPFDAWVDANRNEKKDKNEPVVGDFALLKEMGANSIRIYHYSDLNKNLLRRGYKEYDFMYLMGNFLGMYAVDSGANWYAGTDYTDEEHKANMLESVRKMVEEYKNEPYILMWVLGNENNYGAISDGETLGNGCRAQQQPEAYYSFVNECAKLIKSLDPHKRPVAICNGDAYMLDYCSKYAPDIDVYGANVYRGDYGMGQIWRDIARQYNKPVLITEFGCPAYAKGWSAARIEQGQALYHKNNWNDIINNTAGVAGGAGNSLGGVVFEWVDEWWKSGYAFDANAHDTASQWLGPFLDGRAYEEWFGITSQGNGNDSPFKRQLRKSYFTYKQLWKNN
ncbi:MAG: hypothetical protein LBO62_01445 [Endomicrobium sp.]|jgi:beta-glucuronidase|nr:hypothetical protein [Endomicrobium sp.]